MTEDEKKKLEERKAEQILKKEIAEAEKERIEAEVAKVKAQFPKGDTKPVEGKTTANDSSGYMVELVAYDAMGRVAEKVAKQIDQKIKAQPTDLKETNILIVEELDVCGPDVTQLQLTKQFEYWESELGEAIKRVDDVGKLLDDKLAPKMTKENLNLGASIPDALPVAGAPLSVALGLVSSLADIVGYFKVDYEIKSRKVELADLALQLQVAGHISGHKVYLPNFHRITTSLLINTFNQLIEKQRDLMVSLAKLKRKEELVKKKEQSPQTADVVSQAEAIYIRAEKLVQLFGEFNKEITTVPKEQKYSPFASAVIREHLDTVKVDYLLHLKVISSGGESIIGKAIWRWGKIRYVGGCTVAYALADIHGKLIAADTLLGASTLKEQLGESTLPEFRGLSG